MLSSIIEVQSINAHSNCSEPASSPHPAPPQHSVCGCPRASDQIGRTNSFCLSFHAITTSQNGKLQISHAPARKVSLTRKKSAQLVSQHKEERGLLALLMLPLRRFAASAHLSLSLSYLLFLNLSCFGMGAHVSQLGMGASACLSSRRTATEIPRTKRGGSVGAGTKSCPREHLKPPCSAHRCRIKLLTHRLESRLSIREHLQRLRGSELGHMCASDMHQRNAVPVQGQCRARAGAMPCACRGVRRRSAGFACFSARRR